jgi:hypothetical protein
LNIFRNKFATARKHVSDSALKSVHEVKVNLVGIRLSVDSDHLGFVGLNCLAEELPIVVNNFLAQARVGPYFFATLLLGSILSVEECSSFRVD